MRFVRTRSKYVAVSILVSAFIVGGLLTVGEVPLAVSQPVTIPARIARIAVATVAVVASSRIARRIPTAGPPGSGPEAGR